MDMVKENDLWLHPTMASRHGLRTGDYVQLKNQDDVRSDRIRVLVTERIRPDCVYMVQGFGHTSRMLKRAYRKGASDSGLITQYATDPLMGGTGMNVNFVTLEVEEA
jgi:thiosulfate reductase/polysulfide reductase chain A